MNTKHTNGGWQVRAVDADMFGYEVTANGDFVAGVQDYEVARLIAAAPELLEVAKQMAQAFKAIPHGEWPSLDLCRAAIAKAEGGQDE